MKKNSALTWIIKEAKHLRAKDHNRKTWKEYVSQASAIYASKHKGKSPVGKKRKVGRVPVAKKKVTAVRKKQVGKIKVKRTVKVKQTAKITGITYQYRYLQNAIYLKRIEQLNKEEREAIHNLEKVKAEFRAMPAEQRLKNRSLVKKQLASIQASIKNIRAQISSTKSLIK